MKSNLQRPRRGTTIRLTLAGLIALCVSLVAITAVTVRFLGPCGGHLPTRNHSKATADPVAATATNISSGPWGELMTLDLELQQPEEYVALEVTGSEATWTFPAMSVGQVRSLMKRCGMPDEQVALALSADRVDDTSAAVLVKPGEELLLEMTPDVRSNLYSELATWTQNRYMQNPYHLSGSDFETAFRKSGVDAETMEWLKKLIYSRGGNKYFSDIELLLHRVGNSAARLKVLQALTYQTAVMARLQVTPDSDVDKLVGYWGASPGVRAKDLRPLLESLKRTPLGGSVSLLYLLPSFARERLYTFPLPTEAKSVRMDCHWTALNFFNEVPDDRLQDSAFASNYVKENFYQIGCPSMLGDLVFVLDSAGGVIHSAVHVADDLYFTKNGVNFGQPWILMRSKDLLTVYTHTGAPRTLYYRRKAA